MEEEVEGEVAVFKVDLEEECGTVVAFSVEKELASGMGRVLVEFMAKGEVCVEGALKRGGEEQQNAHGNRSFRKTGFPD